VWLGGVIVKALDLRLYGGGFDSWPLSFYVKILGKLFTKCASVTMQCMAGKVTEGLARGGSSTCSLGGQEAGQRKKLSVICTNLQF